MSAARSSARPLAEEPEIDPHRGPPSFVGPGEDGAVDRYLGPATVVRVGAAELEARLPNGDRVSPRLALAFPFEPAEGDTLLVIGQGGRFFVIGVVASTGRTSLRFQGDVAIRAESGAVDLHGEHGVSIEGPRIDLRTRRLEVLADKATEAFGSVVTRVKALLSVHAGESDTVVQGEWSHRSERASITSQEVVSVNGKEVHLG